MNLKECQSASFSPVPNLPMLYSMTYTYKLSRRLAVSHPSRRALPALCLLLLLAACGASSPAGPDTGGQTATPGWLTVQLTSPYTDDGAIQLRVTGPTIDSIAPEPTLDGFGSVSGGTADVVVTGAVTTGNIARFRVADVNRASSYTVSVMAAAQQTSYALRANTSVYGAVIVR